MGTFKHCGRLRSARLIGRDLSKFHVRLGQPKLSVNFLIDLLRGYQEENWTQLKVDTHMELADVYHQIGDTDKYFIDLTVFQIYIIMELYFLVELIN